MQPLTSHNNDDGEEDWVVLSPSEIPPRQSVPHSDNIYLNFQLRTRFGTFSFSAQAKSEQINKDTRLEHDGSVHLQEQSPLFRLPTELRLDVYEHIFRIPVASSAVMLSHRAAGPRSRTPTSLSILLTCRLVLSEAETLFYALNRLSCSQPRLWIDSLGPRRRAAVTKLSLAATSAGSVHALLQDVGRLENLTSLELDRRQSARFQSVAGWRVMEKQIVGALRRMGKLEEVRVVMLEMEGEVSEAERERERQMREVDGRICRAVGRRRV